MRISQMDRQALATRNVTAAKSEGVSMITEIASRTLSACLAFGALSAVAGGVLGVFANGGGVPLSYLDRTPFATYLVPGLLLGIVIGGTQLLALLLLHSRHLYGLSAAALAGFGMIIWIFVELAIIREYSALQAIYLALGAGEVALVLVALGLLAPLFQPISAAIPESAIKPWKSEEA